MSFVGPLIPEVYTPAYFRELTRRLEDRLNVNYRLHDVVDSDMANSWVNYSAAYSVKYFKDHDNLVHLQGLLKDGDLNSVAFTLPVGFRPTTADGHFFAVPGNAKFGYAEVDNSGDVTIYVENPTTIVALDGITFISA